METEKFFIQFLKFGLDGCKCFLHDFCSCAGDNHKQEIFQEGICNGAEVIGNRWICNGAELIGNSSTIVQLKNRYGPQVCAASYRFKGFTRPPMLSDGLHIGAVPLTPWLR